MPSPSRLELRFLGKDATRERRSTVAAVPVAQVAQSFISIATTTFSLTGTRRVTTVSVGPFLFIPPIADIAIDGARFMDRKTEFSHGIAMLT